MRQPLHRSWNVGFGALMLLVSVASADTINVPDDAPTIQAGIHLASNGDEVVVASGTYFGPFDFLGKSITLHRSAGPSNGVVDAADLTIVLGNWSPCL